jgi:YD repeat-containing protein
MQTLSFVPDAENRLVEVSGGASASFVYDGDGRRVKATVNGVTTYYAGDYYEVSGGVVKKYYSAGGQRIAMRITGQREEAAPGLYFYNARWCDCV